MDINRDIIISQFEKTPEYLSDRLIQFVVPQPRVFSATEALPDGYKMLFSWFSIDKRSYIFLVYHESFPVIPSGVDLPFMWPVKIKVMGEDHVYLSPTFPQSYSS